MLRLQQQGEYTLTELSAALPENQLSQITGVLARVSEQQLSVTREALEDYIRTLENYHRKTEIDQIADLSVDDAGRLAEKIRQSKKS
jgi:hypothetical protein